MNKDWNELTKLTKGAGFTVERVRLKESDITIEGPFELPPLALLSPEDQTFAIAFIRCHGSIKEMESLFGISYPTVKNRLNALSERLPFVEINPPSSKSEILERLRQGEISVEEALKKMKG